jgi:asparagine synthase (glutamine-hydrolysing)
MCGILGYKIFNKDLHLFRENSKKFFQSIKNRGPDSNGEWSSSDKTYQVFNTRLKIQDQNPRADMPMLSTCKNFIISYNGELFNKKQLIEKYLKNQKIITNSDTEVILLLYKIYKEKMLNFLDGMFSISIFCCIDNTIFIARDPLGIKPLYYTINNDFFFFSSSIKSFFFNKKINQESLIDFFSLGFIRDPNTILNEVFSLNPGSFLIIKNKKIYINRYYSLISSLKKKTTNITENIENSIIKHYTSEVPSCLFLSSGVDSNIILSCFIKNKINIPTISIAFEKSKYEKNIFNELSLVRKICNQNNIQNIEKIITQNDVKYFDNLLCGAMDQPTTDGLNTFIVSHIAKENNFKVGYSGLGGDELFCNYGTYEKVKLIYELNRVIKFIGVKETLNFFFKKINFKNPKFKELFSYNEIDQIYFLVRSLFSRNERIELLNKRIHLFQFNNKSEKIREEVFLATAYLEYKIYLQNQLLRDSDWTSMYNSLELRVPFANPALIENSFQKKPLISRLEILRTLNNNIHKIVKTHKKIGFYTPTYQLSNYHNPLKKRAIEVINKYIQANNLHI